MQSEWFNPTNTHYFEINKSEKNFCKSVLISRFIWSQLDSEPFKMQGNKKEILNYGHSNNIIKFINKIKLINKI